jgi:hypothetical protein
VKTLLRLGFIGCALSLPLYAQTPAKKKATPTVQELQQRIIDLQNELMECQKAPKVAPTPPPPDPYTEAVEGFRVFKSTLDTGLNQSAYRDALIPLKVKVDRLEDTEKNKKLKDTLALLVDAGQLWNVSITQARGGWVLTYNVSPFIAKYPPEWSAAGNAFASQMRGMRCYFQFGSSPEQYHDACIRSFSDGVLTKVRRELESLLNASK